MTQPIPAVGMQPERRGLAVEPQRGGLSCGDSEHFRGPAGASLWGHSRGHPGRARIVGQSERSTGRRLIAPRVTEVPGTTASSALTPARKNLVRPTAEFTLRPAVWAKVLVERLWIEHRADRQVERDRDLVEELRRGEEPLPSDGPSVPSQVVRRIQEVMEPPLDVGAGLASNRVDAKDWLLRKNSLPLLPSESLDNGAAAVANLEKRVLPLRVIRITEVVRQRVHVDARLSVFRGWLGRPLADRLAAGG